jgi:protein-disulfide isomerase
MQRWHHILLVIFLATLGLAQEKSAPAHAKPITASANKSGADRKLPTEDTVNAFLQQMFGYDSTVSYKVTDIRPSEAEGLAEVSVVLSSSQGQSANKLYITQDGKHALVGEIMPFGEHPFAADNEKLQHSAKGPSRGPADAPVTMVEFSDLQCPHCKEAQPKLDKFLAGAKNVRLVYQNFPLPMHDWAAKAAAFADCVGRTSNDAFWKFIQGTYDAQSDITAANADEKLTAIADAAGVKGADIAICAAKPDSQARVEASVTLGQALDVNSTPTIFINGRKINGFTALPDEAVQSLVDFAAKNNQK